MSAADAAEVLAAQPHRSTVAAWQYLAPGAAQPILDLLPQQTAASFLSEGTERSLEFLKEKAARHPEIEFLTLPRYDAVVLF